ncbi:MAG: cytochrome P450 [Devosia sp.]
MATVTIDTFEGAANALRNPDLAQALYDEGAVVMADALIVLHGEEHRKRRHMEFGIFRRNFFRWYETEVFPKTLESTIAADMAKGRTDVVDLGYRVTMNLTADFAGIDRPNASAEETAALLKLVMIFSEGATLVHSTRDKDVVRAEVRQALAVFQERFLAPAIDRRKGLIGRVEAGEMAEDDLPRDVLTVLLRNEDRLPLPPDVLTREIAFYLQAGAHSTANSTVHGLNRVFEWRAAHPANAERLRTDPLFLQRCVHESLRLHPASPVAWRKPMAPITLTDGREVSEGDRLVIDLQAANRDPSIFGDNADAFDPNRTIPPGKWPFGLTFGFGVHACLGRDLDGGLIPRGDSLPGDHQYGTVTLFIRRLLSAGARLDPDDPPTQATYTERANFGRYPIVFDPDLRWTL